MIGELRVAGRYLRTAAALTIASTSGLALAMGAPGSGAGATPAPLRTVIGKRLLGYSVELRPILAYHLGTPNAHVKAVVLGQIHGDEPAGVTVANAIIHGHRVTSVDLWVIPTVNPDGDAHGTRQNAHGVDLNRNWPNHWVRNEARCYTGPDPLLYASGCNSGPRALSEPETRALYAFFARSNRPWWCRCTSRSTAWTPPTVERGTRPLPSGSPTT